MAGRERGRDILTEVEALSFLLSYPISGSFVPPPLSHSWRICHSLRLPSQGERERARERERVVTLPTKAHSKRQHRTCPSPSPSTGQIDWSNRLVKSTGQIDWSIL